MPESPAVSSAAMNARGLTASPDSHRLVLWPFVAIVCTFVFCFDTVAIQHIRLDRLDLRLHQRFMSTIGPTGHSVLGAVTLNDLPDHLMRYLGLVGLICIVVVLAWLFFTGRPFSCLTVAGGSAVILAAEVLLKQFISRPGPAIDVGYPGIRTFPSGHTALGVTFYVTLAYVISRIAPSRGRNIILGAGALMALLTALSALTFHFPSEVLGGLMLAGVWLSFLLPVASRWIAREPVQFSRWLRTRSEAQRNHSVMQANGSDAHEAGGSLDV